MSHDLIVSQQNIQLYIQRIAHHHIIAILVFQADFLIVGKQRPPVLYPAAAASWLILFRMFRSISSGGSSPYHTIGVRAARRSRAAAVDGGHTKKHHDPSEGSAIYAGQVVQRQRRPAGRQEANFVKHRPGDDNNVIPKSPGFKTMAALTFW